MKFPSDAKIMKRAKRMMKKAWKKWKGEEPSQEIMDYMNSRLAELIEGRITIQELMSQALSIDKMVRQKVKDEPAK